MSVRVSFNLDDADLEHLAAIAQQTQLRARNEKLKQRRHELRDKASLEREARRLGMVKAGEKAYVVELPPR